MDRVDWFIYLRLIESSTGAVHGFKIDLNRLTLYFMLRRCLKKEFNEKSEFLAPAQISLRFLKFESALLEEHSLQNVPSL